MIHLQLFGTAVEQGVRLGAVTIMSIVCALKRAGRWRVAEALFLCAFSPVCDLSIVDSTSSVLHSNTRSIDISASVDAEESALLERLQKLREAVCEKTSGAARAS
jgi:hypothetical protein